MVDKQTIRKLQTNSDSICRRAGVLEQGWNIENKHQLLLKETANSYTNETLNTRFFYSLFDVRSCIACMKEYTQHTPRCVTFENTNRKSVETMCYDSCAYGELLQTALVEPLTTGKWDERGADGIGWPHRTKQKPKEDNFRNELRIPLKS